jgi:hypothetical protein
MLRPDDAIWIAFALADIRSYYALATVDHRFFREADERLWRDANCAQRRLATLVPDVDVSLPKSIADAATLQDAVIANVLTSVHPDSFPERALGVGVAFIDAIVTVAVADLLERVLTQDARTPRIEQRFAETMKRFESAQESFVRAIDRFAEGIDPGVTSRVVAERVTGLKRWASDGWRRERWRESIERRMRELAVALAFPPERSKTAHTREPSPDEKALFGEILDHPEDDAPRMKWAELVGAHDEARALLVKDQLKRRANARKIGIWTGESELTKHILSNHPDWADDVYRLGADAAAFCGGFVEDITIRAEVFLDNGAKVLRTAPIRRLRLTSVAPHLEALLASGLLDRLLWLDLSAQNLNDTHVEAIVRSRNLTRLRVLSLEKNGITSRGVRALWTSKTLAFCGLDLNVCPELVSWELTPQEMSHYEWVPTEFAIALEAELGPRKWSCKPPEHLNLLEGC